MTLSYGDREDPQKSKLVNTMKQIRKLGLGTVQWGMAYGISNQGDKTSLNEVALILDTARRAGVSLLDTASLYGEAESALGANSLEAFQIITKTPRFAAPSIGDDHARQLVAAFERSLANLAINRVDGLLAHHAPDLLAIGGDRLIMAMQRLKDIGKVSRIGVSIYDGAQIEELLRRFTPDIVQLPVNVLDQRLIRDGQLQRLKDKGVEIHVRSVFLQGLLLMPLERLPTYFEPVRPLLVRWHAAAREQGMSSVQAALSFVRDLPEVDVVLVGVESSSQLQTCIVDFSIDGAFNASGLASNDPAFVNPIMWKTVR